MEFDDVLKEHRDLYLFVADRGRVMFRLLDFKTYSTLRYIMKAYPEFKFDLEDKIWDLCVLEHSFPMGKDHIHAGVITTLSQLILYLSCPQSVEAANTDLIVARREIEDARQQAILTICEAFPSYLPETLEAMTWPTLTRRLAQAESILKKEFEYKRTDASQPIDDSGRIFDNLMEYTNETIDFSKENRELQAEEHGKPKGDYNLQRLRGQ